MPRLKQWIPSKDVVTCLDCGIAFSFLVRRHHCRLCGFCSTCSNQENRIPEVLMEEIPASPDNSLSWWKYSTPSKKKRLCHCCYCRTISIQQVEPQMLVLMILIETRLINMHRTTLACHPSWQLTARQVEYINTSVVPCKWLGCH